jgi:pyruvate-formate lyase-activating enzyme
MQQNRNKKQDIMSPTERVNLWKRIYEIFWPREIVITLFGGEPFLHPKYLNNLLTKATDALLPISRITAVTNGTMIEDVILILTL